MATSNSNSENNNHNNELSPQLQIAQQYLSKHRVKELYARLVFEVTLYRPNDPIAFMMKRLTEFKQMKIDKKLQVFDPALCSLPHLPKLVLVLGPPGSGKTFISKKLCEEFEMNYIKFVPTMRFLFLTHPSFFSVPQLLLNNDAPENKLWELLRKHIKTIMSETKSPAEFVIDDFPRRIGDAVRLEQEITECRFAIVLNTDREDYALRTAMENYEREQVPVIQYFTALNKAVHIDTSSKKLDEVFKEVIDCMTE